MFDPMSPAPPPYRSLSASERAALVVRLSRAPLLEDAPAPAPDDLASFLPAAGRRTASMWPRRGRVREGVDAVDAAASALAHGWQTRDLTRTWRRLLGRAATDALVAVHRGPLLGPEGERFGEATLWVFRTPAEAEDYRAALSRAGRNPLRVRQNMVVTGEVSEAGLELLDRWLADILSQGVDQAPPAVATLTVGAPAA